MTVCGLLDGLLDHFGGIFCGFWLMCLGVGLQGSLFVSSTHLAWTNC